MQLQFTYATGFTVGTEPAPIKMGACACCAKPGRLNARICRRCEGEYGRRIAELIARARKEPAFALALVEKLGGLDIEPLKEILALQLPTRAERPGLAKCGERRKNFQLLVQQK